MIALTTVWQIVLESVHDILPETLPEIEYRNCTQNFPWSFHKITMKRSQKFFTKISVLKSLKCSKNCLPDSKLTTELTPKFPLKLSIKLTPKMSPNLSTKILLKSLKCPQNCFGIVPKKSKHSWITGPSECNWLWQSRFQHFKGCQAFDGSRTIQTWN